MKRASPRLLLTLVLLLLYISVGFLTWRAHENRDQASRFDRQQQGTSDIAQVQRLVDNLLRQRQTQLSAITQFLSVEPDAIRTLIGQTPMLNHLLAIDKGQLSYPLETPNNPLSEREKNFVKTMEPLINDPTLLLQSAQQSESKAQQFGWFISSHQHQTALLYWEKKDTDQIVIYALSYALLRADLIGEIDSLKLTGALKIVDNGQILLLDGAPWQDISVLTVHDDFSYPLAQWSISYQLAPERIDAWGRSAPILIAAAVLLVLTLLTLLGYRAMQRRINLASRQVHFVGQVSHELKTPLTNINLYTQLLSERNGADDKTRHYLNVIEQESQRLTRLIQNVLDFNTAPSVHRQPVAVLELLNQVKQTFTPSFHAKSLVINVIKDVTIDEQTTVHSDRDKLMQIIGNLLSNAEKYAHDGGCVDLSAVRENQHIVLSVRDYGQGVTKSALKQLFKPFYRVNNQLTEGVSGTGIGLTICQQLADSLGANIRAEICEKGLKFLLVLPIDEKSIS